MKFFILLLSIPLILSAQIFEYSGELDFIYDSNMGQNRYEKKGSYLVPEIKTAYLSGKIPLKLFANFKYDSYIEERSFDDHSPFLTAGLSFKIGKKPFFYRIKPSYELFMANNVYSIANSTEKQSWSPALRAYNLENLLLYKKKKYEISLPVLISFLDYGNNTVDSTEYSSSKEGFYLTISPSFERSWKVKKKKVKVKSLGIITDFEWAFLENQEDAYAYGRITGECKVKLFYPTLSSKLSYAQKRYSGSEEDPHTGEFVWGKNHYIKFDTKLNTPITKSLSVNLGCKFANKKSNLFGSTYNRTVLSLGVLWEGKISQE